MIMSNDGIGFIRRGLAIHRAVLHPLPPASQAVPTDDQGGHGRHAGHQVHRPVPATSCGRTLLLTRRRPGETLAAQALRGSGQHSLPPVLVGQRILVAYGAAWWAGLCGILIVSILVVRWVRLCHSRLLLGVSGLAPSSRWWLRFSVLTSGTVFQVPAGGRPIDRTPVKHPIHTTLVRKTDGLGSQRVIGYGLLRLVVRWCLRARMLSDLFFGGGHRYTPSFCSEAGRSVLC